MSAIRQKRVPSQICRLTYLLKGLQPESDKEFY